MTMKHTLRLSAAAGAVALAQLIAVPAVLAGPAEDFADGNKRYEAGDLIAAMPLLKRAADAGHAAAQAVYAGILDQADDDEEAIGYFRKSAMQGNSEGQYGLGSMLAAGEGGSKNPAEAKKWITLAAEQGHLLAINDLAFAYIVGGLDIAESDRSGPEALRWIRAAAERSYLPAMQRLATAYKNGELGLAVDAKAAKEWEDKIAKLRNVGQQQGRRGNRNR